MASKNRVQKTQRSNSGNSYANRKLMQANASINSKTQRAAKNAKAQIALHRNDDYQIMCHDESTNIQVPKTRAIIARQTRSSAIQIRSANFGMAKHYNINSTNQSRQSHLTTRRETSATSGLRKSKESQRRSVLDKSYRAMGTQPLHDQLRGKQQQYQPTLGQQSMFQQQRVNSYKPVSPNN